MNWREEKIGYLKDSRDYSNLLEDPQESIPSKTKLDYERRRQKIKEMLKQKEKVKSDPGSSSSNPGVKQQVKRDLPYANSFGSFFGPSEKVVVSRVVEADRNREEAARLAAKVAKQANQSKQSRQATNKISSSSKTIARPSKPLPKTKLKVQKLKENRDYSFLFSDDADNAAPQRKPKATANGKSNGSSTQPRPPKEAVKSSVPSKPLSKPVPSSKPSSKPAAPVPKTPAPKTATTARSSSVSKSTFVSKSTQGMTKSTIVADRRPSTEKRLSSEQGVKRKYSEMHANGHAPRQNEVSKQKIQGRPLDNRSSGLVSKTPDSQRKAVSTPSLKQQKAQTSVKLQNCSSKPQQKQAVVTKPKQVEARKTGLSKPRLQREASPDDSFLEDDDENVNYRSYLPEIFRVKPRYREDDGYDSSDMEVGFSTIQAEEARSARIAREEDERERILIEEEERQERLRKKKRKA